MGSATKTFNYENQQVTAIVSTWIGKWKFSQYKKLNKRQPPQQVQVGCSRSKVDSRQSKAEDVKRVNQLWWKTQTTILR